MYPKCMKTLPDEGGVYVCNWIKRGNSFEIQIQEEPELKVRAASLLEAEQQLIDLVEEALGDLQPCFEYVPPLPKESVTKKFEGTGIVAVSGANDPLDYVGHPDELFTGGICSVCKKGIGTRTDKTLRVSIIPNPTDGAFVRIRVAVPFAEMSVEIFSEAFVQALTPKARNRFQWLPVESEKKTTIKLFEPISVPVVNRILPKGLISAKERLQPDGFKCRRCGRLQLQGIPQGAAGIYSFVEQDCLPDPLPSCFQIGQTAALEFCFQNKTWTELVGKPGTKRLLSRQVGIVKRNQAQTKPDLRILD